VSKRILVVEDQQDNRQILRDLLTNADFEVIEAEDGGYCYETRICHPSSIRALHHAACQIVRTGEGAHGS